MATAHDVTAYILAETGEVSTWKLQKLLYYAQAWQLAWEDRPLFPEQIEAWANGPVVRDIYREHRGQFVVSRWDRGSASALDDVERDTVDAVIDAYGKLSGRQLSHLTHSEPPWQEARNGLPDTARSSAAISLDTMKEYYSALDTAADAQPVASMDIPF